MIKDKISDYQVYVNELKLSDATKISDILIQGLQNQALEHDIGRLMCGAIGQSSETAELLEEALKPMSPKFVDELGDVYFYVNVSATALGIKFNKHSTDYFTGDVINDTLSELQLVQKLSVNTGKYLDIIKKILFQGKKIDEKVFNNLVDLLNEIYFNLYCIIKKLNLNIYYLIMMNRNKLDRRYKKSFSIKESENKI